VSPADRWEERLAVRCIAAELGVEVDVHDDGSEPSMHDLNILYPDRPPGAVEVTAAADPDSIALGTFVYDGERWIVPNIAGGWMASLQPTAKWKAVQAQLPVLLQTMEGQSVTRADPEVWWRPGPYDDALRALGILHLMQSGTDFPGSVYLMIDPGSERTAGMVPTDGRPLLEWLAEWFARPDKIDNLKKLEASGADERHLFLIVPSFAEAPFAVTDLLSRDGAPLPDSAPALPTEITHVWVVSTWSSGDGMRWAPGAGWSRFVKSSGRAD
jgi:hypothetical protein